MAALWTRLKDDLKPMRWATRSVSSSASASHGFSQSSEVILFDESTSALRPDRDRPIEDLIAELKKHYTIVIVTHNMQQAGVSQSSQPCSGWANWWSLVRRKIVHPP